MRYIPPQLVGQNLPKGWAQRAQQAANAVAAAQPSDRADKINSQSRVWQDVKEVLKRASHDKCWYCESIDIRSDNAVDHFRPKNAVAECTGHDGYWWLAFRWENYRFCCTFCNCHRVDQAIGQSGGKATHFPISDKGRRAALPTDDLRDEEPLLLDPALPADPGFLWFDESGQPAPHPVCGSDPKGYLHKRVTTSIRFYHLDHPDVVEQRKSLCSGIRRSVEEADRHFVKYNAGDGTARQAFEDAVQGLRDRLAAGAPYSATARAMLMGLRGKHPFVDAILAAA